MTRRKYNHSRRADGPPVLLVDLAMPPVGRHSGPSMLAHLAAAVAGGLLALAVLIVVPKTLPKGTSTQPVGGNVPPDAVPRSLEVSSGFGNPTREPDLGTIYWDRRYVRSLFGLARRKVRRTKAEIERERQELYDKTLREIDAIVAEYHALRPLGEAKSIGAVYARYSSRFQDSIADQVRTVFEAAYQFGIFIPRENVFIDMAVRGYQRRRPGLTALHQAIQDRKFNVLLVFSTNRIFRRAYMAQQFVEEELLERSIRAVFLQSGIDTDAPTWRIMFQALATIDEAMVRMCGGHVRAAHEGLFLRGMVCTSLPLGFTGEIIAGELTKRKLPRRRIVVDPDTRQWIMRIFEWYVLDRKSIDQIARDLNDNPDAPAPAKSLTGIWTHALVRKHLMNPCYRGFWVYGAAETRWSGRKDYAQRVARPEPLKSGQFEDLRIISDETWHAAQKRLAEDVAKSGRKPKDGRKSLPNLLRALFVCPEHSRQLVVSGAKASILYCPVCRGINAAIRPLFTHLNRKLALRLTCEKLAELVCLDEDLVNEIIIACQREADAAQRADPETERQLQTRLDKVKKTIDFNRRNPGDTEEEQNQTEKLLRQLRR